jgi:hypothetical protein
VLLLLFLACPAADPLLDETDTGADDTGDPTDSDPAETGSADTGRVDTDTDLVVNLTFVLDGDGSGHALGLWRLDPTDGAPATTAWATAPITGDRVTIGLNDAADVEEIDPDTYPGTYAAFYLPAVFADDGDATHDATDESFVAVGDTYALWLEGTLPADFAALGLQLGWNAVRQPTGGAPPGVEPLDAIPLPLNLLPGSLTVGGSSDGVEDANLALLPWVVLDGGAVASFLFDQDAPIGADGWSITVDGAPPTEHFAPEEPGQLVRYALEAPLAYLDTDAVAGLSNDDTPVGFGCDDGRTVLLMWLEPPTSVRSAWAIHAYGYTVGWQALSFDGDAGVPVEDPSTLTLSCSG